MKFHFLQSILICLLITSTLYAQNERKHWFFGQFAGMTFTDSGQIVSRNDNRIERRIVLGQVEGPDNLISVADEAGDLLFYSDGRVYKNKLNQNMLNSPTDEYALWETQAAVARDPGNPDRYYVFITINDELKGRLSYTIIDMSLDGGLGGLVPDQTHVLMASNIGQPMVTARHANGRDIWLICLQRGVYLSYLITENGIASTPVSSSAGVSFVDGRFAEYGVMEVSPNNELIATGFPQLSKLCIAEFDDLTGKLSLVYEEVDESTAAGPFTSVEFSSNSEVLYTSYINAGIQQYDISDVENIPPRVVITDVPSIYPYLKRGPDGRIFSIERDEFYIGAIENPNELGTACDYRRNVLSLSGPTVLDLPTFLLPKYPEGISYINICEGETTEFNYQTSLRNATYEWNFGDGNIGFGTNVFHTFSEPGTYTVSVKAFNEFFTYTDETEITIFGSPSVPAFEDEYLCSEDTNIFLNNYDEQALNGLSSSEFTVSYYLSQNDALLRSNSIMEFVPEIGSKNLWIRVENTRNPSCYDVTSFTIVTPEFFEIDMPTDQFLCSDKEDLILSAPDGFLSYEWSTGETTQSITVDSQGIYGLRVVKDFGAFTCEAQTEIKVTEGDPPPVIEEIRVIDWSANHNSIEVFLEGNSGSYEYSVDGVNWQDSPQLTNLPLQDYTVYVRDAKCLRAVESERLFLLYYDKFFTPNNDGVNDRWRVINSMQEENIKIYIYDRYGKMLASLDYNDNGWDGRINGELLPTSDYWFRVVRENGQVHNGHFTLKR